MGSTIVEKILGSHAGKAVRADDIVDVRIDVRAARDFGGANVVQAIRQAGLGVHDPDRTVFTFDCNPTGSDQKYASNQQVCREFAREHRLRVFDIDRGIGTHLAMDLGLVGPGDTFVSTDSHANILGAICAFGQGMGDQDVAHAFAHGSVWFQVPPSVKIALTGKPGPDATPKDVTLALLRRFGANGLLGVAAELVGPYVEDLDLAGRVTIASMFTEMGAIIGLLPLSEGVRQRLGAPGRAIEADADAAYAAVYEVSIDGLGPLVSRPGHPEDVVPVEDVAGTPIDSALVGSCTNGRLEDIRAAARVLESRSVAPGVVFKVVPSTNEVWVQALLEGLVAQLKKAGVLFGNAGCAGCAAGQIGQNGPGEVTITTGNRNFAGKQGKGEVYLASPQTVAASAAAGCIASASQVASGKLPKRKERPASRKPPQPRPLASTVAAPTRVQGRAWVIPVDNIDTDMIFHNRHLAITERSQMGQHAFGNLKGYEDFASRARPGDILIVGKNFGAGSSRQQAVDCFLELGVGAIVAESFGAIYERNAINAGLPIVRAALLASGIENGDEIRIDFVTGAVEATSRGLSLRAQPFSEVQLGIYLRGGLLAPV